jgi:hypothetical protein
MVNQFNRSVRRRLDDILGDEPSMHRLNMALRHLAKWRAHVLEQELVKRSGDRVLSGPFAGMAYPVRTSEGSRNPRLIGSYEASLAPVIEEIVAGGYRTVIDVGCAEGYYAVGLARRMPGARVIARDTDAKAHEFCRAMAEANGVADRVQIGGEVSPQGLAALIDGPTVIVCDTEGAEEVLLDPVAAPGLVGADLLVEVHEGMKAGRLDLLRGRFAPTHEVRVIGRRIEDEGLPDWAEGLGDLDRLLLLWEWRSTPTPWLWMKRRVA